MTNVTGPLPAPRSTARIGQRPSCVRLLEAFLRREAAWARRLGLSDSLPFADLAAAVEPSFVLPPQDEELVRRFATSVAEARCLRAMLRWCALRRERPEAFAGIDLPDPYEPLGEFLRRGGAFGVEHREFVTVNGLWTLHAAALQVDAPPDAEEDLSPEALDRLDAGGSP